MIAQRRSTSEGALRYALDYTKNQFRTGYDDKAQGIDS
jgi:hypothetical protein